MKGLGVTLGLVVLLSALLLVAAAPTFADKQGPKKDHDPPAWGHQKDKPNVGQQAADGHKSKGTPGANHPANTTPITPTETITICHKPGTPAEKTLVLPAAALWGHTQHGDELGACLDAAAAAPVSHGRWRHRH